MSTAAQAEDDKVSLGEQLGDCEAYCAAKGYEVVARYQDAKSGATSKRPDFQRMIAAANERAFDRAKEFGPDLILMDLMMPYLDGLDQIRLFSLDRDPEDMPIIVITAKARALDGIEDPRALGIVDWLYKPLDNATLLAKIRTTFAARRP